MRTNKFGIRGLKAARIKGQLKYFWIPPVSLQKRGLFKYETLGADFEIAIEKAREWNAKLEAHRRAANGMKPKLTIINPGTVGYLLRQLEASPHFSRYSLRTQQDYSWMFRNIEVEILDCNLRFGEMQISKVTKQIAFGIYEQYCGHHGLNSASQAITACQAAFRYGMQKYSEITINPFSGLDKLKPSPRRQRWTDNQLHRFIKTAEDLGYPSVGRCALMCIELMQRPGDILSLKWGAYQEREKVWHIQQTKRGAVVRVPETRRLCLALSPIRRSAKSKNNYDAFSQSLVCPTITSKRWHRRNFTKAVRRIGRAAGLPDDLQIRDLRRTAATEGASAGATPAEMMAVGGWANQASIRPYLVQTLEQATAFQSKRDVYRSRHTP